MPKEEKEGLTRRAFLTASGITLAAPLASGIRIVNAAGSNVKLLGPGQVPISFTINEKLVTVHVEPRVTLLEALRHELNITGAKRVCDRASCGACSVLLNGKLIYSCSVLAVDAQDAKISTVEGLGREDKLHPLQQAFVDHDGQQCGFCTPGFVMASFAFLKRYPNPTPEQINTGLGGNLCRCGTYANIRAALLQTAKAEKGGM